MQTSGTGADGRPTIILTVDVEDWFQVENLRTAFPHGVWDSCAQKVRLNTKILLELFDHYQVHATFFVLGWTAERNPELVREIHSRGHEVASHGYAHCLCPTLSESQLREDLHKSKSILEHITGSAVTGYRAPAFSISDRIMDLLCDEGYTYDSSWNGAAVSGRYGTLSLVRKAGERGHYIAENGLLELPISNLHLRSLTIPWGGGGYFRFWPFHLFAWGVKRILDNQGYYLFYFHPWELDSVQPHVRDISPLSRFRHYRNLELTFHKINTFLSLFQKPGFTRCADYLGSGAAPEAKAPSGVSHA